MGWIKNPKKADYNTVYKKTSFSIMDLLSKVQENYIMEQVVKFLKEAETYYLATVEGDQPRVRPFGTAHIFEGCFKADSRKSKGRDMCI